MPSFIQSLDASVTILRLREIASKLLEGGNLHLHNDVEKVDDWMRVLRLAVFTESKASADLTDSTDGTDNIQLPFHFVLSIAFNFIKQYSYFLYDLILFLTMDIKFVCRVKPRQYIPHRVPNHVKDVSTRYFRILSACAWVCVCVLLNYSCYALQELVNILTLVLAFSVIF